MRPPSASLGPEFQRYRIPERAKPFLRPPMLIEHTRNVLLAALLANPAGLHLVSFDGFQGAGKTQFWSTLFETLQASGALRPVQVGTDLFVRTRHDTPERAEMLHDEESYWRL